MIEPWRSAWPPLTGADARDLREQFEALLERLDTLGLHFIAAHVSLGLDRLDEACGLASEAGDPRSEQA